MHNSNIILLKLKPGTGSDPILYSLCSQGTLAEWNIGDEGRFQPNTHSKLELPPNGKIRHAAIDEDNNRLIVNQMKERNFVVYDLITLKVQATIPQVESIPLPVTRMQVLNNKLVYILGKNIVT